MTRLSRDQMRRKKLNERRRQRRFLTVSKIGEAREALIKEMQECMATIATYFATQEGCEHPRPLKLMPEPGCLVAQCHANVVKKVHFHGGRAVWGWHFTLNSALANECFVEGVFHAVWESPQGELIDITPQSDRVMAGREAGVFMPLNFFCEDKRYSAEYEVEDMGNGQLIFRQARESFPERQLVTLGLE